MSSILSKSARTRILETLLLEAFSDGLVHGTVHTSVGQEYTAELLADCLSAGDWVFGTHRSHHLFLALGGSHASLFAEVMGREGAASKGLGGTQHLQTSQFFSNGIQGGMVPIGLGAAMAAEKGSLAVCVIGDGTFGQGVVYEVLNWAKLLMVPMMIVVEDNGIAQSTPSGQFTSSPITKRIQAFGWKTWETSTLDLAGSSEVFSEAAIFARTTGSPVALVVKTQRLMPHSKGDDNRPKEEIENLWSQDPIMIESLTSDEFSKEYNLVEEELREIFEEVKKRPPVQVPYPKGGPVFENHLAGWKEDAKPITHIDTGEASTVRDWVRSEIASCLEDESVLFIGEDIETLPPGMGSPYGGAFGVARGLSVRFPSQVKNTPISEQAITGATIGRALAGKPTIAEFMFSDFATLAVDQIRQQASKIPSMYGVNINLPCLFRLPGGGRRGYGPTHSQNLEDLFVGTPNLICVSVNPFLSEWRGVYRRLLSSTLPALIFESKDLYGASSKFDYPEFYDLEAEVDKLGLPIAILRSPVLEKAKVTVVTFGVASLLVTDALRLLFEDEIAVEVVVCSSISPWPVSQISESLDRTGKLLLVEEGLSSRSLLGGLLFALEEFAGRPVLASSLGSISDSGASRYSESEALISSRSIADKIRSMV